MIHPETGDKLWFVHAGYPIIIRVTVLGVASSGGFLVDEPTGYGIEADCLFKTVEEAAGPVMLNIKEAQEIIVEDCNGDASHYNYELNEEFSLKDYRELQRSWITWVREDEPYHPLFEPEFVPLLEREYPEKARSEWINVRQIRELNGMPLNEFEELYKDN
jgi:hypothetical protein